MKNNSKFKITKFKIILFNDYPQLYRQKAATPQGDFPTHGEAENALWGIGQRSMEERPTPHGGKADAPRCISLPPKRQSQMQVESLRLILLFLGRKCAISSPKRGWGLTSQSTRRDTSDNRGPTGVPPRN